MRQLAGFVLAGAVLAAAIYLTVDIQFGGAHSDAKPDLSVPTVILLGVLIAVLMATAMGLFAEIRHLRDRRRDREWSLTTGGGPRA